MAVGVVAAVVLSQPDRSAPGNDAAPRPPELPRLIPADLPAGLEIAEVQDDEAVMDWGEYTTYRYLYGEEGAERPFDRVDLDISVTSPADQLVAEGDELEVEVRGRSGLVQHVPAESDQPQSTAVIWTEGPEFDVSVASRTLEAKDLLAIAEQLRIDGTEVALGDIPPEVPVPLVEVGRAVESTVPGDPASRYHHITYSTPDRPFEGPSLYVMVQPGDEPELMALAYDDRSDRRVDIRGHKGWLAVNGGDVGVGWVERPWVLVYVGGWGGVTEEDVLAAAESLDVATGDEWEAARQGGG